VPIVFAADYELVFFPQKAKVYKDDTTEVVQGGCVARPIFSTLTEAIVRKAFVCTSNEDIATAFTQEQIDPREGVLKIIKQFRNGRKYPSWSKNGYYSRDVIDQKLVALCRILDFKLFDSVKPLVSHKFFNLYDFVRDSEEPVTISSIMDDSTGTLKNVSLNRIVTALLANPELKDKGVQSLIEGIIPFGLDTVEEHGLVTFNEVIRADDLHNVGIRFLPHETQRYMKMFNRKLHEICRRTQFESWENINYIALRNNIDMCMTVIDELSRQNKEGRLQEIAEKTTLYLKGFYGKRILAYCLLKSPTTDIYYYKKTLSSKSLIEHFMHLMNGKESSEFRKIIHRLTDEQFHDLAHYLCQKNSFQDALYMAKVRPKKSDDKRLAVLYETAMEMQGRIGRWARAVGADHLRDVHHDIILSGGQFFPMRDAYMEILSRLLQNFESYNPLVQNRAALLLEIFRTAHVMHEHQHASADIFGCVLQELAHFGIKPNTPLCPENPEDQRLLLSAYVIMRRPFECGDYILALDELEGIFRVFNKMCQSLSQDECNLLLLNIYESKNFFEWFEQHREGFACSAKRLKHVHKLLIVGENSIRFNESLVTKLLAQQPLDEKEPKRLPSRCADPFENMW
jgi:hypothetical protein